ncbi:hypothetical protein EK21DRAFT_85980 [Setomelanomma holmii]|uniref:Uncharacterized protein n=1 Tax=Setomelanomma holmii TaxID=210430 RepID=A0A9P4LR14_9PLEO|nr:hypothetical protein EK21DRAFT_85980 [Setomelanomma holmii]
MQHDLRNASAASVKTASHRARTIKFFDLPLEIREPIYDAFWTVQNRVAAYHRQAKVGILAYYDGMHLDESDLTSDRHFDRASRPDYDWRPDPQHGLPACLRANKQFLSEAMEMFYQHAHWNVWPVLTHGRYVKKASLGIMAPEHARSMSICRMLFKKQLPMWTLRSRRSKYIEIYFEPVDAKWLDRLAECLGEFGNLHSLKVAIGCPCIDQPRTAGHIVEVNLEPIETILKVSTNVRKLEVEIFGFTQGDSMAEALDSEVLQELKKVVAAEMGQYVSETTEFVQNKVIDNCVRPLPRQIIDEIRVYENNG